MNRKNPFMQRTYSEKTWAISNYLSLPSIRRDPHPHWRTSHFLSSLAHLYGSGGIYLPLILSLLPFFFVSHASHFWLISGKRWVYDFLFMIHFFTMCECDMRTYTERSFGPKITVCPLVFPWYMKRVFSAMETPHQNDTLSWRRTLIMYTYEKQRPRLICRLAASGRGRATVGRQMETPRSECSLRIGRGRLYFCRCAMSHNYVSGTFWRHIRTYSTVGIH